jgi:hypothetical protein
MSASSLVITDTNVLVLMVITGLHKTICEAKTFGTIVVPDIIEEEVRAWLSQNSSKRAKFGKLVDDIYDLALRLNKIEIPKIDPQKLSSKKSQIKMVFRALQSSGKSKLGAPPSDADSAILAITMLTDSRICTQEKTLITRVLDKKLTESLFYIAFSVIALFLRTHFNRLIAYAQTTLRIFTIKFNGLLCLECSRC